MNDIPDHSQWPLDSCLVSHQYKVVYLPIAKNANTTLKRMFVRLSGQLGQRYANDLKLWRKALV